MNRLLQFLALCVFSSSLWAQSFPNKPVKLIVPFPAGGPGDIVARIINTKLAANLGQPVVIENKVGASAILGAEFVSKAAPDGYTLLVANLPVLSINQLEFKDLPYSPEKDLVPVGMVSVQPYVIAIKNSIPASNLTEFIALAKKEPGKYTYGAQSSSIYLATELFGTRTGIKMTHVPYKGTAPAMNDLMGGHIDFLLGSISAMVPMLNSGKVRALTVTSPTRNDSAKTIPSYTEFGIKDMTMTSWVVIMAPAGTPQAVIDTLNAAINKTVDSPEVIKSLMQDGVMPQTGTPAMAAAFIRKETEQWRAIAKQVGMVPGGF
jgi:tripartite-type tricarboxylate transporter receptor subunit TctC